MSVIASICASSILSIYLSDDKHQEIPAKLGEIPSEIMAKIPDDITLTLHNAKFQEKTPGNCDGVKYP